MNKYKKYILFEFDDYYPGGGLSDITDSFDTIEDLKSFLVNRKGIYYDNKYIVDRDNWEIIEIKNI